MKFELYDDSTLIYEAPILNLEIWPDSPQNPLICYDSAQILDLLHRFDLHTVNMQVHISLCVEICRPPVEEASCSYVADSEEFVPEIEEHLMMVVDEFVPETEKASMTMVENFVPDTEDQVVMAMEIKAQGEDWRAEVANSMLQILLPWYFELVRSNPAAVLVIFVGFAAYVIFLGG
ncbi:hypothetical protein C2S52_011878 [Perilla frutescens var. hirtella]|nr:hypothetical protein C2S52_011878 [Perilla frutescens var. hirtella]